MLVKIIEQLLWDFDADLRHTLVFAEEYLQRVAATLRYSNDLN